MGDANIFSAIPSVLPDELFEVLAEGRAFTLERIVSQGHATPAGQWYDQSRDEWVILLKGGAGLLLAGEDEVRVLTPGDYIHLPAHLKHRVEWTDAETIWLALHFDPKATR